MSCIPPSYGRRVSLFHVEAGLLATGSPDKTVEVVTMIIITGMVMMISTSNDDDDAGDFDKNYDDKKTKHDTR